jgi:hypothetical protein
VRRDNGAEGIGCPAHEPTARGCDLAEGASEHVGHRGLQRSDLLAVVNQELVQFSFRSFRRRGASLISARAEMLDYDRK